jgi:hypothetical protein
MSAAAVVEHPQRRRRRRLALRTSDVGRHLDTFLVCAVAAVLGNRIFLIITGYPQLGNGTLHISHAIWGGMMMMIALVIAIAFLPPFTRSFVAFLGGAGFGWFIDELGKFITRKVNYFFQPTIAIIYMVFVAMYLVFRSLARRRYTAHEGVLNALEALKSAAIGELDEEQRRETLHLLEATGPHDAFADEVRDLLADAPALAAEPPGWFERRARRMRAYYRLLTERAWFGRTVGLLVTVIAIGSFVEVLTLSLDDRGLTTFSEKATVVSSLVGNLLVLFGVVMLRRDTLRAYRWFERGILVSIFVTQVFTFAEEQLAGILGLVFTLALWILVRGAIRAERERDLNAENDPLPARA